jgi:hypothetical protein
MIPSTISPSDGNAEVVAELAAFTLMYLDFVVLDEEQALVTWSLTE